MTHIEKHQIGKAIATYIENMLWCGRREDEHWRCCAINPDETTISEFMDDDGTSVKALNINELQGLNIRDHIEYIIPVLEKHLMNVCSDFKENELCQILIN